MTTTPDTVNVAGTADPAAPPAATTEQMTASSPREAAGGAIRSQPRVPRPDFDDEPNSTFQRFLVGLFVAVPLVALVAAIPLLWGWGLGWHDVVIALVFYWISGLGVTVGYHRYFTHGSFKAKTGLRVMLAIFGTMAIEGPAATETLTYQRQVYAYRLDGRMDDRKVCLEVEGGCYAVGAAPGGDHAPFGPALHAPGPAQPLQPARVSQLHGQVQVAASPLGGELFGKTHADYEPGASGRMNGT